MNLVVEWGGQKSRPHAAFENTRLIDPLHEYVYYAGDIYLIHNYSNPRTIMNTLIQGQLDRVEAALNTLTASIESYNPSVSAAIDLLAADDELQQGVKLLAQHQVKQARILHLRAAREAQEQQTKATLTLLAETRKDLLSTPATTFPTNSRNVPVAELLEYARKISRHTVPPTFREPPPQPKPPTNDGPKDDATPVVNGSGAGDAVAQAREANAIANGENPKGSEEKKGVAVSELNEEEVRWLNDFERQPFVPWPREDIIKRGALGQIQLMLEQGVDPEATGAAEEVARKMEAEEGERDVQMAEGPVETNLEVGQRNIEGGERMVEARREEKPKVFKGLDLDEDSDED
ncbi:MAG: hypothetical protein Q9186_002812 [Xanthomendoza sp. 1 TL-2023]